MSEPCTLADYARLVAGDLQQVLADMGTALALPSPAGLASPLFGALGRPDQVAVQTVLGRAGGAAEWPNEVRQAWHRAIQAAQSVAPQRSAPETAPASLHATLRLTLKDEQEVEEEIELARMVQQLESEAESTLRELRPLAASVRGDQTVAPDAVVLHPQAAAAGLGEAVRGLPLSAAARLACLHVLSLVAVRPLADAYRRHLKALEARQVKPAQFRVRLSMDPRAAGGTWHVDGDLVEARMTAVLGRLVQQVEADWVQSGGARPGDPSAGARPHDPPHDLRNGSPQHSTGPAAWPRELADEVMQRLLHTLGEQSQFAPPMRGVLASLTPSGQRLAAREPTLWHRHEHPWWQLLDRLMGLCAVLDDAPGKGQTVLATECEPLVTRFGMADAPDTAACLHLLAELDELVRRLAQDGHAAPAGEAADGGTPGQAPHATAAEAPIEQVLRDQMAQQLRQSQAPASLRRFLLGPWVDVLSRAMHPSRGDAARARRYSEWVDALLSAVGPSNTGAPPAHEPLLAVAREGLAYIVLPQAQIESWLFDLTLRLSDAKPADGGEPSGQAWRHDELPTVPIDLPSSGVRAARARRDREAWLISLRVGDICRVFIDAAWRTLQLVSMDEAAQTFVLQERGNAEPHRLTRAALERLRAEGLATTVEPGAFIAQAMDSAVDALSERATSVGSPRSQA